MYNKTLKSQRIISIVVVLVMSLLFIPVSADVNPTISFTPSSGTVRVGNEINVTVTMDKQLPVAMIQFTINFDPQKLKVLSNDKIKSHVDFPNVQVGFDNTLGKATIVELTGEDQKLITPPYVIATFTLTAIGTGSSAISINNTKYSYIDNGVIQHYDVSTATSTINVTGGGSTPTPSPTPSVSPSPTPTASPTPTPSETPQVSEVPVGPSGFVDVGKDVEWAEEAITELAKAGIISGSVSAETGKKVFKPEDKVTRAEFAKLIVGAFNLPEATDEGNYSDVSKDDWYYKAVTTASKLGIVKGYDGGIFDPNKEITREEMCVMLIRAAKAAGLDIPDADLTFDDASSISDFATTSIAGLAKLGIINGKGDNKFAPLDNATRAESAKVIYAIYKMFKAIQ